MRVLRVLFCAVALTAWLAPGVHADEYTKQTFLTFSAPVQLPGIVLPAGTYQFKLADPESGRRVLQVWDKDGSKLLTTLLTIPDQRMTATDDPVVMFAERPSGQPHAIRAWFYPNESYGQEFVYPKSQAMEIARDTHQSVLAYEGDARDEAAYKSAAVGRVDEHGAMTDMDKTTAPAATATNSTSPSAAEPSQPASTVAGNTTSEANRDNSNVDQRAVGTSGAVNNATSANRTAQATTRANAAAPQSNAASSQAPARELPRTASSTTLVQLLAGLSLAGALILRAVRTRTASSR